MSEDWLGRWDRGRTGWHEPSGNEGLKSFWPDTVNPGSVLVPLCGKTPDLLWLAQRGHAVVGVELSKIAIEGFFADHDLEFELESAGPLSRYTETHHALALYCGDYFDFQSQPFDALYDRGALVALAQDLRPRYVEHTRQLLKPGAIRLVITLEYDQRIVNGPPFSVSADELVTYWDDLIRVGEKDDIDHCPPKFRKAGLSDIAEVFWLSR
ncbi:MAG: thiopurine S-methyltransferase [Proteobacteria bacterium]|nr:thiopurine S-methyltransferase [Pseudomonadota bacterium]